MDNIRGKKLSELDTPLEKALWIRMYDEANNPKGYNIINPNGTRGGMMKTGSGNEASVTWPSAGMMAKAVSVMDDPSIENISRQMGQMHKVRNFYNNIADPNSVAGDVTIDTHAVSANLLQPLSGEDAPVLHNFGRGVKGSQGPVNSSVTGNKGTYGIMAEPYRRLASDLGVIPRQVQSVTWEGIRGLFNNKSPQVRAQASGIWNAYTGGRITQEEAQNLIFELAKGMRTPAWHRTQ